MVKSVFALLLLAACPQAGQGSYFAHPYSGPSAPTPRKAAAPKATSEATLIGDCRAAIANGKARANAILAFAGVRAADNTVEPYNEIERELLNAGAWAEVVAAAHPDAKMREAAGTCSRELAQEWHELWLDHRVYDALKSVDTSLADAETKKFVASVLRDMKRSGVELEDKGRARLREIDAQLDTLAGDFRRNLEARTVTVTDPARLAGMPEDWLAAHKADAQGAVAITTNDFGPVMTYADDE